MTEAELLLCRKLKRDHTGREKAIPGAMLAEYLRLSDTRQLRNVVNSTRRQGNPVISLNEGYFWPDGWDEYVKHCINLLLDMSDEFKQNADDITESMNRMFGEPSLF